MTFSWHLRERAARQLVKRTRCCWGWVAWTITLLLILSSLAIPLESGKILHPIFFGVVCIFFLVPAGFRARSVLEPIWHPATVVLPKNSSLLGLHPDPKPVKCFHVFSKMPIPVLVILLQFLPLIWQTIPEPEWFHENEQCCASNVSILFGSRSAQNECDLRNFTSYEHECSTDPHADRFGYEAVSVRCQEQDLEQNLFFYDLCAWMYGCRAPKSDEWQPFHFYKGILHAIQSGDRCWQLMTFAECLKACEVLPAELMVQLRCNNYSAITNSLCTHLGAVPSHHRCHADYHGLAAFFACSSTWASQWLVSCGSQLRYNNLFNAGSFDPRPWDQLLQISWLLLGVVCPSLVLLLLFVASCCSPLAPADTAFRFAVYSKARALQERLDAEGQADIGKLGHFLFRMDLILVFADFLGDIFAVYTWIATSHPWFAAFQSVIILRSLVDIVRLQRQEGLINEVKRSLGANTLTDGLYKLVLQEKTVEGTQTSMLLAYGLLYTFDSPLVLQWTLFKWTLSVRSMTNGCFIQFHLVPGDILDRPLLNGTPLGRSRPETE